MLNKPFSNVKRKIQKENSEEWGGPDVELAVPTQ